MGTDPDADPDPDADIPCDAHPYWDAFPDGQPSSGNTFSFCEPDGGHAAAHRQSDAHVGPGDPQSNINTFAVAHSPDTVPQSLEFPASEPACTG